MSKAKPFVFRCTRLSLVIFALLMTAPSGPKLVSAVRQTDDRVTVQASGRGKPLLNLSDGRDLSTLYTGPAKLRQALVEGRAEPLTLAAGDFDGDGVDDFKK